MTVHTQPETAAPAALASPDFGRPRPDSFDAAPFAVSAVGWRYRGWHLLLRHGALAFAVTIGTLWLLVAVHTHTALRGDNVEQTVWMHSLEWGYYKHPPLTTWLAVAAAAVLGHHWWLTNVLGWLCLVGTAVATYALALRLVPRRTAQLAIVLWGLHLTLTWRADLYNHNSVLVLLCALLAWAVVSATQERDERYWLLAGALAGAAMLAKYQAAVPIVVIMIALARGGYLADPLHRRGLFRAALLGSLLFAPHLFWLASHHFAPLQYASTQLPTSWSPTDQGALLGFTLQQLRLFWPALAGMLICMAFMRPAGVLPLAADAHRSVGDVQKMAWVRALSVGPIAMVLVFGLAGTQLQNHWGMQTLQYCCLGLAAWLAPRSVVTPRQFLAIACALHGVLLAPVLQNLVEVNESGWQGRGDKFYPGRQLATRALADWQRTTSCSLRYVVGPQFEAGTIAAFSGSNPLVFEEGKAIFSPWIDQRDVAQRGALYVAYASENLPRESAASGSMQMTTADQSKRPRLVYWGVVLPESRCPASIHGPDIRDNPQTSFQGAVR